MSNLANNILKKVGQGVGQSLGLKVQDLSATGYYPDQWWGDGVTPEGGQLKGVYTEAFWLAPPFGRPRDIDYERLEPLENSVWVRMCIQHIVDSIAGADWDINPRVYGEEVSDETIKEVREFFQSDTWAESWGQVLRQSLPDMINYDCGVISKIFPVKAFNKETNELKEDAVPMALTALDGRSILKDVGLFKNLKGYWQYSWINPQGVPIHFGPHELIYLQQAPSAREPYGTSTLEVIQSVLDYMMDSTLAQSKYWKNGLFIGGQIDLPEVTDVTELKRMQAYYEAKLRGPRKYNKWIVTGGGAKVQSMPFTSQQMQWMDSQKWFAKMVFGVYKVTPSELGFTEDLNRATGLQQMQIHKSKAIRPVLKILEEAINREIVWRHFSTEVKFVFNKELDLEEEAKQADIDVKRLGAGLDSVNELRDRDGKEKWEDEKYDLPNADQQQPEEEEGDWGDLFGGGEENNDPFAFDEDDMDKAATAGAISGEAGYVPAPEHYDGPGKPLKLSKMEQEALDKANKLLQEMSGEYDELAEDLLRGLRS